MEVVSIPAPARLQLSEQILAPISDPSQVAELRRSTIALAGRLGFDDVAAGKAAIIATELGSNLLKHAGSGEVLLRALAQPLQTATGLELLSIDSGPGIPDVARALRDGFSTAGSAGVGLGAVQRLASEFDLYSSTSHGTSMVARLWSADDVHAGARESGRDPQLGAIRVAHRNETRCGDDWGHRAVDGRHTFVMADGLGHGELAAVAASAAIGALHAASDPSPAALLETMHGRLRPTRGAAVLIVQVDLGRGVVRHAGAGNITAVLFDGVRPRHLVSQNGTVGHEMRRVHEIELPCSADWTLVMHSDGLSGRWDLAHYPGLLARSASLIAAVLYRDHKRGRDDATVLAVKGRLP